MATTISGNTGVSQVQDGVITQSDIASPLYLPTIPAWQSFASGVRNFGNVYSNTSGYPIKVSCSYQSVTAGILSASVDGIIVGAVTIPVGQYATLYFDVPNGSSYTVTAFGGTYTFNAWSELR